MRGEFLERFDNLLKIQHFCKSPPDFFVPLPDEVPIEEDHLLTPFPFILEAPVLNPCIPHEVVVKDIIDNAGHNQKSEYQILEQVLQNDPNALKEDYFLEKLQGLISADTELVIRVA